MKKIMKFISIFAIISVFMTGNPAMVCADGVEIWVEGESQPDKYEIKTSSRSSGNAFLQMWSTGTNILTQTFTAGEAGEYQFTIRCGGYGHNCATDLSVSVNGGEMIKIIENETVKKYNDGYTEDLGGSSARTWRFNTTFRLNKGTNKIMFLNDGKLPTTDGSLRTAQRIDYYKFTKVDGKQSTNIDNVECVNGVLNVFEKGQNVAFKVNTMSEAAESRKYNFEVSDFWGKKIITDTITIAKGCKSATLNFGTFDLGWYRLKITDGGKEYYNKGFSVIHPYSSREKYESTPFGFDFASTQLVKDKSMIGDYAKAARLAGATWVRERYGWNYNASANKTDISDMLPGVNPISSEGIDILETFDGRGFSWDDGKGGIDGTPADIFDAYNFGRLNAAALDGKVSGWEMLNECEGGFWKGSLDDAAAFIKAASIGVDDSGSEALKLFGGFSVAPTDGLKAAAYGAEHFLMNDILRYSDANNFHEYSFDRYMINGGNLIKRGDGMKEAANAYWGENNKILWCSETALTLISGTPDTEELLHSQARGAVTVPVKHFANGTRKINYFILPHYMEDSASFGIFGDGYPYAVYSVYSNTTYQLGKAEYKGKLADLPEGARGELFNNGKNDVAVIWGDKVSSMNLENTKNAVMIDMFGIETKLKDNPTITFSNYPIFVRFEDKADDKLYFPTSLSETYTTSKKDETRHYAPNEKIVLRQDFEGDYTSQVRSYGHTCDLQNGNRVTLELYNFNNSSQVVDINARIGPGLEVYPKNAQITVDAMGKATADFTVKLKNKDEISGEFEYLKFSGNTADGEISHSVSKIYVGSEKIAVEPEFVFENSKTADGWEIAGNSNPGTVVNASDTGDGVDFTISKWGSGDRYFYPYFKVTDEERAMMEGKNGLCFTMYVPEYISNFRGNMFMKTDDGRKYWVSEANQYLKGWNQYYVDLEKIELFSSPLGALDARPLLWSEVTEIGIGCNSTQDYSPPYIIKDIGMYTKIDKNANIFKFDGIEDGGKTKAGEDVNINITVADGMDMSTARLMLNEKEFTDFTVNGNVVNVKLKNIKRGDYSLFIACEKPYVEDIKRKTISFRAE